MTISFNSAAIKSAGGVADAASGAAASAAAAAAAATVVASVAAAAAANAASAANQVTGNASLSSIDGKLAVPLPVSIIGSLPATVTIGAALPAGANAIGDVGLQYRATATGAASSSHLVAAATTNATVIKASAGRLLGWNLSNNSNKEKFVKFHNTNAAPTPGAGVVRTVMIPAKSTSQFQMPGGIAHSVGIGITITDLAADANTTAVAAGDVIVDLFFM